MLLSEHMLNIVFPCRRMNPDKAAERRRKKNLYAKMKKDEEDKMKVKDYISSLFYWEIILINSQITNHDHNFI